VRIYAPYFAIGSGFEIALGAFYMNATAIEAVEAVKQHCKVCGGDTQIVRV